MNKGGKNNIKDNYTNEEDIIIEINNLFKSFGQKKVINDLNLEIKKGEIFSILGKNGAGKTTLFKIILNLMKEDSGSIKIMDQKNGNSKLKREISFLGENYELYSFLTAEEIVRLAASFYEVDNIDWALNSLNKFNIPLDEKVKNFSKGMKQTLKIIQALINKGDIIILDEPTVGLDVQMQYEIMEMLIDLNNEGKTIIFSSHNLLEVKKLANRIAFIKKGEIIAVKDREFLAKENNRIIFVPQREIDESRLVIKGVSSIEKNGSKYIIYYNDNEEEIIEHLSQIPYFKLNYGELDLEEIYLKITGGDENFN
ncbi:MAG: ABC transporter ATP-binding protein [Bacillota bacterium]